MNTEEVRELLPWYAAGTLSTAETRAVEAELRRSPQLQRELEQYRVLGGVVAQVPVDEPEFRPELMQDALRRIDAYEQAKTQRSRAAAPEGFFASLKQTLFGGWGVMPTGARFALAAQFALILVLGGALLLPRESADYVTTSGSQGTATTEGPRFMVNFQPESTEADMRAVLEAHQLEILSGPSAQGNYTLGFASGAAADPATTLNALRAATDVVRSATTLEQ